MAEPQYRYGGPEPERAQWLKKRREWRASSLYATVKRGRVRDREAASWSVAPFLHTKKPTR